MNKKLIDIKNFSNDVPIVFGDYPKCTNHCPSIANYKISTNRDQLIIQALEKKNKCIPDKCSIALKLLDENVKLRQNIKDLLSAGSKRQMRRVNKYNARKVEIDNIKFDSIRESKRYAELKLLQKAGEVEHITVHPMYELPVNGQPTKKYEADFKVLWKDGRLTVEDTKGVKTKLYQLKKSLMKAIYNIDIVEI